MPKISNFDVIKKVWKFGNLEEQTSIQNFGF